VGENDRGDFVGPGNLDEVKRISIQWLRSDQVRFKVGDVRQSLLEANVASIALLRLDTDFYDSTYVELMYLYPRLVQHGVLIVDDYGHWQGARKAVDDYFGDAGSAPKPRPPRPYFHWIDYTGRMAIRPDPPADELPPEIARDPQLSWGRSTRDGIPIPAPEQRYDYSPPGLTNPGLLKHFPSLVANDPRRNKWPYLRSAAPHIWRTDSRSSNQHIGVLSMEEAILLYHLALPHGGKRGLAIGCHFAWSTAHLLAAHLNLDVVDPKLSRDDQWNAVDESLSKIPTRGSYRLWAAYSPSILPALRETKTEPWSFVFIDGDHEGDAPRRDAQTVLVHCAPDATVVLHDLASPDVTAGLEVFRAAGWNVRIYNTMQIMGVAWRGDLIPVDYPPDLRMPSATPFVAFGSSLATDGVEASSRVTGWAVSFVVRPLQQSCGRLGAWCSNAGSSTHLGRSFDRGETHRNLGRNAACTN
jgi:hypothetical protein